MDNQRLPLLLQGHLRQILSAGEELELAALIARAGDEQLDLAMAEMWENYEGAHHLTQEEATEILGRILPAPVHSVRQHWTRRYTAAAAIVLLLAAGTVLYYGMDGHRLSSPAAGTSKQNDVRAPTGSRTTLTLAGGRQIILDSAGEGMLAAQGEATVSKQGAAGLSYAVGQGLKGPTDSIYYNTLSTARGGQSHVTLADGTQVWLDAASSLRFPTAFTGNDREVELTGEAYFEVAHKSGQPFRVKVNDILVEDIGTHFNVFAYAGEPQQAITLVEGGVKVERASKAVLLRPGEQAVLAENDQRINVVPDADLDQATAWKNGMTSFHGADIATIMRAMERWYDITIEIRGVMPKRSFRVEVSRDAPLSQLLKVFDLNNIHYTIDGDQRKLTITP
jgi:transmembrane sensor